MFIAGFLDGDIPGQYLSATHNSTHSKSSSNMSNSTKSSHEKTSSTALAQTQIPPVSIVSYYTESWTPP